MEGVMTPPFNDRKGADYRRCLTFVNIMAPTMTESYREHHSHR